MTSWNAFFQGDREKNLRYNDKAEKWLLYIGKDADDPSNNLAPNVPVVDVLDMWDFYRMIGYDWKQREWYDPSTGDRAEVEVLA